MKLQVASNNIETQAMDHYGLVAAVCKELKIAERLNARIGSSDSRRVVQPGMSVVAMIINTLGFTNRRLYLTPQFFQSKAVENLLADGITAKHLDDHCLGKSLDEVSAYGVTKLFGEIAFDIAVEHNLLGKYNHLDSTSFSLDGDYVDATQTFRVGLITKKDQMPKNVEIAISQDCKKLYYVLTLRKIYHKTYLVDLPKEHPLSNLNFASSKKAIRFARMSSIYLRAK